jgi:hypothetical protein
VTLHSQKLQVTVMGGVIPTVDNDDAEVILVASTMKMVTMISMTYYYYYFELCFLTVQFASVGVVAGIFDDIVVLNVTEVQMNQGYYHPDHRL